MDGVIVLDSWTNTTETDISSLLLTIIIILLLLCFLALDKRGWPILDILLLALFYDIDVSIGIYNSVFF